MGIYRSVRALKRRLVQKDNLDWHDARDLFFSVCLGELRHYLLQPGSNTWGSLEDSCGGGMCPPVGCAERSAPLMERYAENCTGTAILVCEQAVVEPLTLGWVYQIWNEEERSRSTWAVSRRGETQPENISVAAATQLFTDEYIANFLIDRIFSTESPDAVELFDPACGVGHFLVHGVRNVYERTKSPESVASFVCERLFGVDIDPCAVELCRIVVWLEVVRSFPEKGARVWQALQSTIRAVPTACGSLDRAIDEPLLQRRYRCIATNPPYLARRKLSDSMRSFLDREYPDASADLCAAFMQRCVELLAPEGSLALVTIDKWLRLRGYERLRMGGDSFAGLYRTLSFDLLGELGERAFRKDSGLHDGVRIVLSVGRRRPPSETHRTRILDLTGCGGLEQKAEALRQFTAAGSSSLATSALQSDLQEPTGEKGFLRTRLPPLLQRSSRTVRDVAQVVVGLQTNDDRRLVRFHWEVPPDFERWRVHSKGGGYGRWFGLNRYLLDWGTGRPEFERNSKTGIRVETFFNRPGWTYTWFANGCLGLRRKEQGWSFGRAAAAGFFCDDDRVVAFLNSRFGSFCAQVVGGKIQLPEGVVRRLPLPDSLDAIDPRLVSAAVAVKQVLVAHDPTDVTFKPDVREAPSTRMALEVLLLLIEDELERQVEVCLECTSLQRADFEELLGVPTTRLPCGKSARDAYQQLWQLVPESLRWIKPLVRCPDFRDEEIDSNHDVILSALVERPKKKRGPQRGLPADTRLELVSRTSALHPLEVYGAIVRGVSTSVTLARVVFLPYLADEVLIDVARMLGHRWWGQGLPATSIEPRGFIPLAEVVRSVHSSLWKQKDTFGPFSYEEILTTPLQVWLKEHFISWQSKRLLQRPLVVGEVCTSGSSYGFRHVGEARQTPQAPYGTEDSVMSPSSAL